MSVIWMDDPSFYSTAQVGTRYGAVGATLVVGTGTGRFGGASWNPTSGSNTTTMFARTNAFTAIATGTLAVSFKLNTAIGGTTGMSILTFWDSGTQQIDLRINTAQQLFVTRNGTALGSVSSVALSTGVWYRIEFQATINNTTGSIEVKVNGTSVIGPTSSLNTRNTTNNSFNQASFGGESGANAGLSGVWGNYNDFVVTDSNSPNAGFLGDKRCFLRLPISNSSVQWTNAWASWAASTAVVVGQQLKDGNGNVQQCTVAGTTKSGSPPTWATTGGSTTTDNTATWVVVGSGSNPGAANWMAVSDPITDDDNSYNSDSTPGDIDLFNLASLPAGAQNIAAIDNVIRARKDDAGTRSIQSWISSSGTTQGSATVTLSTSYVYVDLIQETDPHTSSAWIASGANALLVGYKEIA